MDKFFRWFGLPGAVVLTALLSTTALLRALFVPSAVHWLCFAAMLCSSAGDLFLAHLKALTSRIKNCFTIGCIWFMISHSLYALCYGMKSADLGMPVFNVGTVIALLIGVLASAALIFLAVSLKNTKKLPLVLIYLCVILLNCAAVFSYAFSAAARSVFAVFAAIGVFSFLLSDFIIGLNLTGKLHRFDALVWWLYPIGQILLILGA